MTNLGRGGSLTRSDFCLTFAAVGLAFGLIFIVGFLSWELVPCSVESQTQKCEALTWCSFWIGLFLVVVAVVVGTIALGGFVGALKGSADGNAAYGYSLVGLGYALLVLGTINVVAFAGFIKAGYANLILPHQMRLTPKTANQCSLSFGSWYPSVWHFWGRCSSSSIRCARSETQSRSRGGVATS